MSYNFPTSEYQVQPPPYIPPPPPKPRLPTSWISTLCFFLVGISFLGLGFVLIQLFKWRSIWVSAAAEILVIAGLPLLFCLILRYNFKETFSLRKVNTAILGLCVLVGLAAQFAVRLPDLLARWLLQLIFGPLYLPASSEISDGTVGGMLLASLALLVLAPTCEEILNRGFLMAGYNQGGRRAFWRTVIIVGLFFGLFHQYMYTFVGTALGGVVLAYVALTTGSIFSSMAAHFGFNLFPTLVYWWLLFAKDKDGKVLGESIKTTGLQTIAPEAVVISVTFTFFGAALLFFLLRAITRRAAQKRTGLVVGYHGLVKDIYPDSPYLVEGSNYSPGWPYLYGYQGYVTENVAPNFWQASGIATPMVAFDSISTVLSAARGPLNESKAGHYMPPRPRPTRYRPKTPLSVLNLVIIGLVLLFFVFTSFSEVRLRNKGTDCEKPPQLCDARVNSDSLLYKP